MFLFGPITSFDNQLDLDNQYNRDFANSGVYKFSNGLQIQGNPSFITKAGANKIALISQSDITSDPLGGVVNLNGLDSLFMGTVNGSINLANGFTFTKADGGSFKFIELYARNGSADFGAFMNLKDANLTLEAEKDVMIESTSAILANNVVLSALGNTTINGAVVSKFAQVYSGANLTVNGSIAADNIYGFGNTATINGNFSGRNVNLQTVGDLTVTAGGSLNSKDKLSITTGGAMNLQGATVDDEDATSTSKTYTLKAGTDINVGGALSASGTLNASGRTANISNTVTAKTANFTMTNDFNMSGPGAFNTNDLTISDGGLMSLGPITNKNGITLTAGTNALLATGGITFNGAVSTNNINASGTLLTVNAPITANGLLTMTASQDFISNVGGAISALSGGGGGPTIKAAGLITLNDALLVNNATLTSGTNTKLPGALTFNGPVQSQGNFSANGPTETLNAKFSATGGSVNFNAGTAFTLTNLGSFNLTGNANATITASKTITLTGTSNVGGTFTLNGLANMPGTGGITSGDFNVAGTNVTFSGPLATKHFTVNNQGNFLLTNAGSLNASDVVSLTARNAIEFDGAASGKAFGLTAGQDITLNALMQTPGAFTASGKNIYLNAPLAADALTATANTDFVLANTGSVLTNHDINITSTTRDITLNGATASNKLTLNALKGTATMAGNAQAQNIAVNAKAADLSGTIRSASDATFTLTQNFALDALGSLVLPGNLVISGQAITFDGPSSANNYNLTGTRNLTVNNTITAQDFTATAAAGALNSSLTSNRGIGLTLTNNFTTSTATALSAVNDISVASTGGSATISGALTSQTISVAMSGAATVNSDARLLGSKSITLSGNSASIAGRLDAPTVNVTGTNGLVIDTTTGFISAVNATLSSANGTVSLQSTNSGAGGLDATRLQALNITGKTIDVLSNFTLPASSSNLTAGIGGIDATGFDLSGFDTITLNGGDYLGRNLTVNTLTFNSGGNLTLTGDLYASKSVATPGAISVTGILAGGTINATKTIDAGTLAANNVTAGTILTVGDGGLISSPTSKNSDVTVTAPSIVWGNGGAVLDGSAGSQTVAASDASNLTLNVTSLAMDLTAGIGGLKGVSMNGGDADPANTANPDGGNGGTLTVNTTTGAITVSAPISATTGQNATPGAIGGTGGTVNLNSNSTITVNDKIEVSSNDGARRVSAKGGKINITSKATGGTAIQIGSTANLNALLSAAVPKDANGNVPAGTITFKSSGGAVNVNGNLRADRGTIDISNSGKSGKIAMTGATMMADTIKVSALGSNGTLTVGGGSITADTLISLYAGGSNGTVLFADNVSLNGNSVKEIQGNTVTVANGKIVTINGRRAADVFTNIPNYTGSGGNGSTTGTFGGKGARTQPLINGPGPGG